MTLDLTDEEARLACKALRAQAVALQVHAKPTTRRLTADACRADAAALSAVADRIEGLRPEVDA